MYRYALFAVRHHWRSASAGQPTPAGLAASQAAYPRPATPEQLAYFEKNVRPILVNRCYNCHSDAFKEAGGISTTQLGVLFFLQKSPGALLKDVSDALGVNASAITALIGRMEDAGLVRRQPSSDDQRAVHLFATANGVARVAAARP